MVASCVVKKKKSTPSHAVFFRVACSVSKASKLVTVKTFFRLDAMASSSEWSRLLPTPTAKTFMLVLCSSAASWRVFGLLFDLPSVTTIRMLVMRSRSPCAWPHRVSALTVSWFVFICMWNDTVLALLSYRPCACGHIQ